MRRSGVSRGAARVMAPPHGVVVVRAASQLAEELDARSQVNLLLLPPVPDLHAVPNCQTDGYDTLPSGRQCCTSSSCCRPWFQT